nr:MAG TPA: hypothetical protein [Caudoviricetes sp.]
MFVKTVCNVKKHIMPERKLLNVKLKIENGKLMSGRQFAK